MRQRISVVLLIICICFKPYWVQCEPKDAPKIATKKFQINFLKELSGLVDSSAQHTLNQYLETLKTDRLLDAYGDALGEAQSSHKIEPKIMFIKQYIDAQHGDGNDIGAFYALRNVNFLDKIRRGLRELLDESLQEVRQMRLYQLCKQFQRHAVEMAEQLPKLAPITERNSSNLTKSIDLRDFARQLYESVRISGSEIIDDFLIVIRNLLNEVIAEKSESEQRTAKLQEFVQAIDSVVNTTEFAEKRNQLYGYLQSKLANDFEDLTREEADLEEILKKLKAKGYNIFTLFLISNFDFLEHMHEEWKRLLPQPNQLRPNDVESRLFFEVHQSYEEFKKDNESNDKYEAYLRKVRELQAKFKALGDGVNVFDFLYNASQNVGTVTMNVIKSTCDEKSAYM